MHATKAEYKSNSDKRSLDNIPNEILEKKTIQLEPEQEQQ
jgi:hypothetical protein